jgi:hypothetical protein
MGALHLQRKDYSRARQAFSGLLQLEGHKHDTYGQLGTACYYAAIAPRNPKKPEDVGGGPGPACCCCCCCCCCLAFTRGACACCCRQPVMPWPLTAAGLP